MAVAKDIVVKTADLSNVGHNIKIGEQDGSLIIVIDSTVKGTVSKSGKMILLANSGGFTQATGDLKINLNVGRSNPDYRPLF